MERGEASRGVSGRGDEWVVVMGMDDVRRQRPPLRSHVVAQVSRAIARLGVWCHRLLPSDYGCTVQERRWRRYGMHQVRRTHEKKLLLITELPQ